MEKVARHFHPDANHFYTRLGPHRGARVDRRDHRAGREAPRRELAPRARHRAGRRGRDRVDDAVARPAPRERAPHRPRHRVVRRARRPDRRGARVPPLRREEPARATCSGSTTTAAATRRWSSGTRCASATAPARTPRTGCGDERARSRPSPRSTRRCASRCARSSRRRSGRTRRSGRRRGVPARPVHAHGRARLPRPQLSGGVRRPGRRRAARRGVRRGDGALRLGRRRGRDRRARRHRDAADPEVRHRRAEATLAGSRDQGTSRSARSRSRSRAPARTSRA